MSALPAQPFPWKKYLPYALLIIAAFIAYGDIFSNQFIFDDIMLIGDNSFLRDWHAIPQMLVTQVFAGNHSTSDFYRPLQILLYFIVYQLGGLSTWPYHLLNLSLHAANICLVYALGRRLGFNNKAVFGAALIWGMHPVHTEAVTYISATADTLYSFFCLLALITVTPAFTKRRFIIAALFGALGLLSKETAVILPLLAMSCIFLVSENRRNPKSYFCTWPLWLVTGIYIFIRFGLLSFDQNEYIGNTPELEAYGTHILLRIYTFLATLPGYAQLLLMPSGLHMERNFPVAMSITDPRTLMGIALIAIAVAILTHEGRQPSKKPVLSWGLLWFAAAYLPQTGIVYAVNARFLEHWMYLPSAGLILAIAQSISLQLANPLIARLVTVVTGIAAFMLATATFLQNTVWREEIPFYQYILSQGESTFRVHNNLGYAYMNRGDYDLALAEFHSALEISNEAEAHGNIAAVYSHMPNAQQLLPQAISELQQAVAINPHFVQGYENLAILYNYIGDHNKADFYRQKEEDAKRAYAPE